MSGFSRHAGAISNAEYGETSQKLFGNRFSGQRREKNLWRHIMVEPFASALAPPKGSSDFFCHIIWRQKEGSTKRAKKGKKATPRYVAELFVPLCCIYKGFGGICAILSGGNPAAKRAKLHVALGPGGWGRSAACRPGGQAPGARGGPDGIIMPPPAPAPPPPGGARRSSPCRGTARWPRLARHGPAPAGRSWHRACRGPGGSERRAGA